MKAEIDETIVAASLFPVSIDDSANSSSQLTSLSRLLPIEVLFACSEWADETNLNLHILMKKLIWIFTSC